MVREADLVAGHSNEWRRRTFKVLQSDGSSHTPELREAVTEEGRIFEFYSNLFDSVPEVDDDSADKLVERFDDSPALLEGIMLATALDFPQSQFERYKATLIGDTQDFEHDLEVAYYWSQVKNVANIVKSRINSAD
ncbi:MAG: hypothetical protein UT84_C0002G0018 [Candidatus Curtissbacteria bacterium GW2011_GWA1_40_16]|uniref:Uncharacterized protein n=1 Tax=Candidatus Curtissbacteria bacterium GW2011_GWA1_40_16 TaxID=1618405 RepID=A0A0G0ULR0_9BACT|nr:MAG: hypothetical protein UT84_C0002G0018 [Candidatus Curtissbacteria bacterium GW2011_GWA1_40_16]